MFCIYTYIYIYIERERELNLGTALRDSASVFPAVQSGFQREEGVRSNGVVAEVPQFPTMNFHGICMHNVAKLLQQHVEAKCGNACARKAKYINV